MSPSTIVSDIDAWDSDQCLQANACEPHAADYAPIRSHSTPQYPVPAVEQCLHRQNACEPRTKIGAIGCRPGRHAVKNAIIGRYVHSGRTEANPPVNFGEADFSNDVVYATLLSERCDRIKHLS